MDISARRAYGGATVSPGPQTLWTSAASPPARNPPYDINVIIEIPQGSQVKYEIDKDSGAIVVDRFLFTPMSYPAAYGFIPNTLASDGDPADALVLIPVGVVPGAVIRCRPIGVLHMRDEAGDDEKIILRGRTTRCTRCTVKSSTSRICRKSCCRPSSISSKRIRTWSPANG